TGPRHGIRVPRVRTRLVIALPNVLTCHPTPFVDAQKTPTTLLTQAKPQLIILNTQVCLRRCQDEGPGHQHRRRTEGASPRYHHLRYCGRLKYLATSQTTPFTPCAPQTETCDNHELLQTMAVNLGPVG
ncbi:unnamed protein product, partial [Ectocarpus sp. 12 AP-2014]